MNDQLYNIRYVQSGGQQGLFDELIDKGDLEFDICLTSGPLGHIC